MTYNPNNANGQATKANSEPVVIASDQDDLGVKAATGTLVDLGAKADASATTDTGTFSLIALIKRIASKTAALGTAVMSAASPVTIATDDTVMVGAGATQQTRITDGTQQANTVAGDSGQNPLIVAGGRKEVAQSLAGAAGASVDMSNYAWVAVHITAYTSGTLTFQTSNDNTNWISLALYNAASPGGGTNASSATAVGLFHGPRAGRYFRVSTAGTATITMEFFSTASAASGLSVTATSSGTYTVAGGKTNNAAVPGATNAGVLPAVANAADPAWTETFLAALSVDLAGKLRTLAAHVFNIGGALTALTAYAARISTNTTTTPVSSTCYVSSITICVETAGTTSTLDIRDKSGPPIYLVRTLSTAALLSGGDITYNFVAPVKMTSGIDVITGGAAAATVGVFIDYYQ